MTCSRCHHDREAHTHFRTGSDCGACGCTHFRRAPFGHGAAKAVVVRLRHPLAPAATKIAA